MPIYEYICNDCRKPSELLVRNASARPSCPHCGSRKLERQLSTFAAHGGGNEPACKSAEMCPTAQTSGCPSGRCPLGQATD